MHAAWLPTYVHCLVHNWILKSHIYLQTYPSLHRKLWKDNTSVYTDADIHLLKYHTVHTYIWYTLIRHILYAIFISILYDR